MDLLNTIKFAGIHTITCVLSFHKINTQNALDYISSAYNKPKLVQGVQINFGFKSGRYIWKPLYTIPVPILLIYVTLEDVCAINNGPYSSMRDGHVKLQNER